MFEDKLPPNDSRRAQQRIEFRVSRPRKAFVSWSLNGMAIASGTGDAYFWPVRTGEWSLSVRAGKAVRRINFSVIRRLPRGPRGREIIF